MQKIIKQRIQGNFAKDKVNKHALNWLKQWAVSKACCF